MFTIRVDRMNGSGVAGSLREVCECARYRVVYEQATAMMRLDLFGATGDEAPNQRLTLGGGDEAFIMNDAGTTVDIVRTARRQPQARRM
jgi:hypothetical protein